MFHAVSTTIWSFPFDEFEGRAWTPPPFIAERQRRASASAVHLDVLVPRTPASAQRLQQRDPRVAQYGTCRLRRDQHAGCCARGSQRVWQGCGRDSGATRGAAGEHGDARTRGSQRHPRRVPRRHRRSGGRAAAHAALLHALWLAHPQPARTVLCELRLGHWGDRSLRHAARARSALRSREIRRRGGGRTGAAGANERGAA